VEKQPDVLVQIGDFADMASLSSYDVGKKSFEGRRYKADVEASRSAMARLVSPIEEYNSRQRRNGKKQYKPRMILTLGNHEDRIDRAINNDPKLDGTLGISDLGFESFGWEVRPFLEVVVVDGISYSHYHVTGISGRPATTAAAQLNRHHMSCVSGHQQGLQIATGYRADGTLLTSIIAGSCYEHDEDYMGPQGNRRHWRGLLVFNDVQPTGEFEIMPVSLKYLKERYNG
jgi:hypothetical protein